MIEPLSLRCWTWPQVPRDGLWNCNGPYRSVMRFWKAVYIAGDVVQPSPSSTCMETVSGCDGGVNCPGMDHFTNVYGWLGHWVNPALTRRWIKSWS